MRKATRAIGVTVAIVFAATLLTACDPTPGGSMWLSNAEVDALPTEGQAWEDVLAAANGDWGTMNMGNLNSFHDTNVLAAALVAVRLNSQERETAVREQVMATITCDCHYRALETSRNIVSYIIAADLVGLGDTDRAAFSAFLSEIRYRELEGGHSGESSIYGVALKSSNNWGGMARAAMTAIDIYIGDDEELAEIAQTHRAWLGELETHQMKWDSTLWHASTPKAGINRRGAVTVDGYPADGVLPEDQRRSGYQWPPEPTGYQWEGLQGPLVTTNLLMREGLMSIDAGDDALKRAFDFLYDPNRGNNPAVTNDNWQVYLFNDLRSTSYPVGRANTAGKNMGWTQWTHG